MENVTEITIFAECLKYFAVAEHEHSVKISLENKKFSANWIKVCISELLEEEVDEKRNGKRTRVVTESPEKSEKQSFQSSFSNKFDGYSFQW